MKDLRGLGPAPHLRLAIWSKDKSSDRRVVPAELCLHVSPHPLHKALSVVLDMTTQLVRRAHPRLIYPVAAQRLPLCRLYAVVASLVSTFQNRDRLYSDAEHFDCFQSGFRRHGSTFWTRGRSH